MAIPQYVYAVYEPGTSWFEKAVTEVGGLAHYLGSQIGAVFSDDFIQFYKNKEDFEYWWNTGNIKYDEVTQEVTFDADLVEQFKQALIDYNNEMSEYWIVPTESYDDLDVTNFSQQVVYTTVRNLIRENDILFTNGGRSTQLYAVTSNYFENGYAFICSSSSYDIASFPTNLMSVYMYDSNWNKVSIDDVLVFNFQVPGVGSAPATWIETPYTSLSQGEEQTFLYEFRTFYINYSSVNGGKIWSNYNDRTLMNTAQIFTPDGCRVRVFKSLNSYKLYSVNQRAVYFGSDFYTAEPQDFTASLDDLANATDRMNDTLEKLLDKIDDNTDEKTIEELLQQILDEMKNQGSGGDTGGGTGEGGGSGSGSSWSDGMIGSLFGYLEEIIDELGIMIGQLDWIGVTLEDMTVEQVEDKTDSFIDQLVSTFREVSDLLKTKFPFSIPWDLQDLLAVLGGDTVEVRASDGEIRTVNAYHAVSVVPVVFSDDDPGGGGTSRPGSDGGGGHSRGDPVSTMGTSDNGAPVFKLPLYIESAGIDEEIIVDMSPFEWLSKLSRGFLTILFCLGLMHLTFRVIDLGKILGLNDNA